MNRSWMNTTGILRPLLVVLLWVATFHVSLRAHGEELQKHPSSKPVVLAFYGAAAGENRRIEIEFITALQLSLDQFDVVSVDVSDSEFAALPLSQRLSLISTHTRAHHAIASTWVEQTASSKILLHLVALGTGRALVRIIEIKPSPTAGEELAFTAQELIGEAYLFESPSGSPAISKAVSDVKSSIPAPPQKAFSRMGLLPYFEIARALYGHQGPSFRLGGGADLWVPLGKFAYSRFGIGGASGPNTAFTGGLVSTRSGYLRALLGVQKKTGIFFIGLDLGVVGTLHRLNLMVDNANSHSYTPFDVRGQLGANMAIPIAPHMHLVLAGATGAYFIRQRFLRLSDGSTAFATPWLEWSLSTGICMSF